MSKKVPQVPQTDLFGEMQEVTETPSSIASWEAHASRPLVEDVSKRSTFLIKKHLLARMDRMASVQKRGFKTWLVNQAIEEMLDKLERDGL